MTLRHLARWACALFVLGLLCAPFFALAHPGGMDSQGGHDSPDGYHFHHGFPAHQHEDGICPYWGGPYTPGVENPDYALEPVDTPGAASTADPSGQGVSVPSAAPAGAEGTEVSSEEPELFVPVYESAPSSLLPILGGFGAGLLVGGGIAAAVGLRRERRIRQEAEAQLAAEVQRLRSQRK